MFRRTSTQAFCADHNTVSKGSERARRHDRVETRLREIVSATLMTHLEQRVLEPGALEAVADRVAAREVDPYTAADQLVKRVFAK